MVEVHYVHEHLAEVDIGDHVFPTGKYARLARLIRAELGVPSKRFHGWDPTTPEDFARIHTPRYLEDLALARSTWATTSSELPVSRAVIAGFEDMVGGSIAAVRLALEHGIGFHLGGGFHHAFPDHAEGFCYLHDMGIAVERARADAGIEKVLFVDVDVHQGNGTAVVYAGDDDTFTYSIHQQNNYPVKQRSDLDRGLADEVEDEEYLATLSADLDRIDEQFDAELLCYVAGVDPHKDDVLGGLCLTEQGILERDRMVISRYVARGIPVVVFLAGGYAPTPEQTAQLHLQAARACEEAADQSRSGPS